MLAIILRTKALKLKGIAIPAFLSGIFGVTKPAIYGVTLPRKKFFIISCIGGAIGGALFGLLGIKSYMFGGLGIFQFPCFIAPSTNDLSGMYNGMIVAAASFAIGFGIAFSLYKDSAPAPAPSTPDENSEEPALQNETLKSPLTGNLVKLPDVPDPVFASGMMGQGVAVEPTVGKIFAPADGTVIWVGTRGGYGMTVIVDHGFGIQSHFAHMSGYSVKLGEKVKRGSLIGMVGNTGRSTGPHLHYEVRLNGIPQDPTKYMLN